MLNFIHPDGLHDVWDYVVEGLARIKNRAKERWRQEDVYFKIKSNEYWLYLVDNGSGFVILQPTKDFDGPVLFVFAAYIPSGHDVMDAALDEVKALAVQLGVKRIRFKSLRDGWAVRAAQLGYKQAHIEYEMELP